MWGGGKWFKWSSPQCAPGVWRKLRLRDTIEYSAFSGRWGIFLNRWGHRHQRKKWLVSETDSSCKTLSFKGADLISCSREAMQATRMILWPWGKQCLLTGVGEKSSESVQWNHQRLALHCGTSDRRGSKLQQENWNGGIRKTWLSR